MQHCRDAAEIAEIAEKGGLVRTWPDVPELEAGLVPCSSWL